MIYAVFLAGVTMTAFAASGLFFIRFWRASGDKFFLHFAITCFLIAGERVVALFIPGTFEAAHGSGESNSAFLYLWRLIAFGLIFWAMLKKIANASDRNFRS